MDTSQAVELLGKGKDIWNAWAESVRSQTGDVDGATIDFSDHEFESEVDFSDRIFPGPVTFKDATFCRKAQFSGVTFCGDAVFDDATNRRLPDCPPLLGASLLQSRFHLGRHVGRQP